MADLKFTDTHNLVAFLSKPAESEGFEQIVDFLNANPIRYALTINPTIYISCIEQFWSTVKAKTVNGEVQLHALVDGKKIIITESTVRRDLQLEDAEGVDCLPNSTIFEQLTLMGYEKISQKLTFYKAFFSPQWKFLIHTILQCLSSKTTAWNEFSSTMASAIIYLATNQKFNFSKYIFESMVKNLDNMGKFFMYPRFIQVFLDKQLEGMPTHNRIYIAPSHTKKIFGNMRRLVEAVIRSWMTVGRAATMLLVLRAEQVSGNYNKTRSRQHLMNLVPRKNTVESVLLVILNTADLILLVILNTAEKAKKSVRLMMEKLVIRENRQRVLVSKRIEIIDENKNRKRDVSNKNRQSDLSVWNGIGVNAGDSKLMLLGINLILLVKVNAARHNLLLLMKVNAAEGFEQIMDFLNAHNIKYALKINPTIYTSCIEQFWATVKAKTINGEVQLQALVDGKKIIITESIVRRDLQIEDAEGVDCLPNATIFEQLTLMGYEKISQKLAFYKAFFSPQRKFLIHTILQCLCSKTTAWNGFSSTMASAII
ncbi:hypothetical protein Tco_0666070 [Tanacetum coccineum]